jgi:hypothetical protein
MIVWFDACSAFILSGFIQIFHLHFVQFWDRFDRSLLEMPEHFPCFILVTVESVFIRLDRELYCVIY